METGTQRPAMSLLRARRLHKEALSSERQAETYEAIIGVIRNLATDETSREVIAQEIERLTRNVEEFYEDADDRRSQIDPDLIDHL